MNPLKSLMAFVFAVAWATAASAAPGQWTSFVAAGRPYFAQVDARDAFAKKAAASLDLYDSLSHQTPDAALQRGGDGTVLLKRRDDGKSIKPADDDLSRMASTPVLPPANRTTRPARTVTAATSGDPEIDAIVAASGSTAKPVNLYGILSSLKSNDPATFALLKSAAADPAKKNALGNLLTTAARTPTSEDGWRFLQSMTPGALGGTTAGTGGVGTSGAPGVHGQVREGDQTGLAFNPIAIAIAQGKPGQARKDASDAIIAFVTDDAEKYIADQVRAAKGDQAKGQKSQLDGVVAAFRAVLDDEFKREADAGSIGVLYTALIAGKPAPAWVPEAKRPAVTDYLTVVKAARAALIDSMKVWTPAGGSKTSGRTFLGPWTGEGTTTVDKWSLAFLHDAEKQAADALSASIIPKSTAQRIAAVTDSGFDGPPGGVHVPKPGEGTGNGINLNYTAAGFSAQDIYRTGAVVHTMHLTVDGRDMDVQVALKLNFRQEGNQMVPELGIYDISNDGSNDKPAHIYGQDVDLYQIGSDPSDLRLQPNPKSYYDADKYPIKYQISRNPDTGDISFGVDGQMATVAQSELYTQLQNQVEQNGHTVDVNGHRFQVLGQGGKSAQLLFFEADGTTLSKGGDQLAPSLISGALSSVSFNKDTNFPTESVKTGDRQLGYVGYSPTDPSKKQYYALSWNESKSYFEIVPKDAPVPDDAPPPPPADGNNNGNTNNNTNANTNTNTNANNNQSTGSTTDNNNTGAPGTNTTSKPNTGTAASACNARDGFTSVDNIPGDADGKWRYWTGGNAGDTYYCMYGGKFLHAAGYLDSVVENDSEIVVTVVAVGKGRTPGITRVTVGDIVNGHEKATLTGGGSVDLEIQNVMVYHILKAALSKRPDGNNALELGNVAWLTDVRTGILPTKHDSLRVNFDADARKRAEDVMKIIDGYSADDSGVFGGAQGKGNRAKLSSFLFGMIAADTGPLDLAKSQPSVSISLTMADGVRTQGGTVATYVFRNGARGSLPWIIPNGAGEPTIGDPIK